MIGRNTERRLVEGFLDRSGRGIRALLLSGDAGIGKTTIWHAALEDARDRGYHVVLTRPTEAEARMPFAGLNDLFSGLVDDLPPTLPAPQQAALDVALLRTSVKGESIQPLAISLAILEVIRTASAGQPLALGIDDVQWLDESTSGVLRFVLRRLEDEPVIVIATQRTDEGGPIAPLLADLASDRLTTVPVTALSADETDRLLHDSLRLELAPNLLQRVHRLSAGNPFYAVEIGRALQARGLSGVTGEVPLPESLTSLLRGRLEALGPDAREVTRLAAAVSQPSAAIIEAVIGRDRARAGLAEAREHGVLVADTQRIRFSHPLLAAEAYAAIDEADRRELHRRLALVVAEPEELARHLALAASGADPDVARALDGAATHAQGRGAIDAAAELSEMAARATPDNDPARATRMAAAGRRRFMSGDGGRARELLESALKEPAAAAGPGRAELLLVLATVRQLTDDFDAARKLAEEALTHAGDDIALTVELKLMLAGVSHITGNDRASGARHAFEAMELAEKLGDPKVLVGTIGHYAAWRYATGHGYEPDLVQRAAELEPFAGHLRTLDHPEFDIASIENLEGRTTAAAHRTRSLLQRAERDGDYSSLPFLIANASISDAMDGNVALARERLDLAVRLSHVTGQRTAEVHTLVWRVRLESRMGEADAALSAAQRAFELMDATGWRLGEWAMRAALAVLELSRDDPEAALVHVVDALDRRGTGAVGVEQWVDAPAAEALVALGRLDDARAVLDASDALPARPPKLEVRALRARARLLAAEGDLEGAAAAIDEAEASHRRMEDRWETARTLLVAGEIHRRMRRRARAQAAFSEALEIFEHIGAGLWARQAREQLARVGSARAEGGGLTPTQREVAELVASGLTNRQVADRLFMSPHTVEAHLSAVYRALGIRSRVEIEAALAAHPPDDVRDSARDLRDSRDPTGAEV